MPDILPAAAAPASRRRYISVLFGDLSDSTRIAAALEAEIYADLLACLREAAEEVVTKHGGTIVQLLGDGVVAIFGYPGAREDDGRRAVEAALELHERVRAIPLEQPLPWRRALGMHSGIHAGLVLVEGGDHARGRVALVGDPPNIAARLSGEAADGEILVSVETLGPEAHFFRTEGPQLLTLAGRATPLPTYRILGHAEAGSRFEARARRGLSTFVGRESELAVLEAALQNVTAGKPGRLAVVAPPGTGKTRLAEEFLRNARSRDCQVYSGYCESYLGAEPMQPYMQILRAVFGIEQGLPAMDAAARIDARLDGLAPGLGEHRAVLHQILSVGAGEPAGERAAPERAIHALRELFAALAAQSPLVFFIDDWQWADHACRVVAGVIQSIRDRGIFELIATRELEPADTSLGEAQILRLAPFTEAEADATIARLLPGLDPFVAAAIRRDAGGNALFLEELCHNARRSAADRPVSSAPGSAAWLDALIESRLARLPDEQANIVRTAAVIGNVVPAWLLEKLTGCGESHPQVLALAAQDFIYPAATGMLRFKHGIARDAIYAAVGLRERRTLHARVAEELRAGPEETREDLLESLAYHYRAAANNVQAARFAEMAGDKALAASALDRAQTQYRAALESLDQQEPSAENYVRWRAIAQRLASACVYDPSREQLAVFTKAVTLALAHDDAGGAANAEYWLGYINYALGESRTATRHFENALVKAEATGNAPLIGQLRATLGQARAAACDYPAALALFDTALRMKREHRSTSRPSIGSAYTLACKAAVLGDQGRFDEAAECFTQALESLRGVHHVVQGSVLCLQSSVLLWQGRWEEARKVATAAEKVAGRVKSLYFLAMSRSLGGYAEWMLTRDPAAVQSIADATSWLESRDRGLFISLNHGWLTEALAAREDIAGARRHAARALRRAHKGDRLGEAMVWRALARAASAGKVHRAAADCLVRALRAAEARGSPHEKAVTQLCAAELALAGGAPQEALRLIDEGRPAFERMQMHWHLNRADEIARQVPG